MKRTPLRRKTPLRACSALRAKRPARPPRHVPAELVCDYCEGVFHRFLLRRRKNKQAFCCRRCARLYREERLIKSGAPAPKDSPSWWRRLRAFVRARDGFRCVLCGVSERELGHGLSIDHVYPRRAFTRAIDVYREFGTNGFASLCPRCHARKTWDAEARWLRGDALRLQQYVRAVSATSGNRA